MDWIRVGDACDILNGFAFKSEQYVNNGIRIIRIANVQKGYIEDSSPVFYPQNSEGISKYMLEEGDLLLSLTGNVGRVAMLEKQFLPAALNQRVACLRLKTNMISKGYLFHILNSDYFERQCIQASKGVAQKNMSTEWLKNFEIPIYTQNEQTKITGVLDKLSLIISKRKQELDRLDDLIKARFVEMFHEKGYPVFKLKELCTKITDGTHKTPNYQDSGITFISAKNIINGNLNFEDVKYITREEYEEIQKRCMTEQGDVLMAKSGSLGTLAIVETDQPLGLFESLAVLKYERTKLNGVFLKEQLRSDVAQRQLMSGVKGVAVKHLHLNVISEISISVPPLETQGQFATFVAQVNKSKLIIQKSLDETQKLFDSLMQEYFG